MKATEILKQLESGDVTVLVEVTIDLGNGRTKKTALSANERDLWEAAAEAVKANKNADFPKVKIEENCGLHYLLIIA